MSHPGPDYDDIGSIIEELYAALEAVEAHFKSDDILDVTATVELLETIRKAKERART